MHVAAVDVGASRIRACVVGGLAASGKREISLVRSRDLDISQISDNVVDLIEEIIDPHARCEDRLHLDVAGVGIAGLQALGDHARVLHERLATRFSIRRTVIASDSITSYLGALGGVAGAVVAAGTGAVAVGFDGRETWYRVDGWGQMVGDEGSGAWIGACGMRAALREYDGRSGGSPALLAALAEFLGSPDKLAAYLHPRLQRAARIAAFAPYVASVAQEGDPVARAIWRKAAERLAEAGAVALARATNTGRVRDQISLRMSWTGGLFKAGELLLGPFQRSLMRLQPGVQIVPPNGESLDGALLLANWAATGTAGEAVYAQCVDVYET